MDDKTLAKKFWKMLVEKKMSTASSTALLVYVLN